MFVAVWCCQWFTVTHKGLRQYTCKALNCSVQGLESQNRSVDGDEVALRILPPCAWWVFKRDQLAAATKAAATEQEPTGRAGVDLQSLAASPSTFSDAGVGEPGMSQSFPSTVADNLLLFCHAWSEGGMNPSLLMLRLVTCCSCTKCGLMITDPPGNIAVQAKWLLAECREVLQTSLSCVTILNLAHFRSLPCCRAEVEYSCKQRGGRRGFQGCIR